MTTNITGDLLGYLAALTPEQQAVLAAAMATAPAPEPEWQRQWTAPAPEPEPLPGKVDFGKVSAPWVSIILPAAMAQSVGVTASRFAKSGDRKDSGEGSGRSTLRAVCEAILASPWADDPVGFQSAKNYRDAGPRVKVQTIR